MKQMLSRRVVRMAATGIICFSTLAMTMNAAAEKFPYQNSTLPIELRVEDLLQRMTLEEKALLTTGESYMDTRRIERLGIPALKMTDGPHGVRWDKTTCFPTDLGLAATWDPALVRRVGVALAEETLARGRNVILGPCINIHRDARGGRNFESFGEDPYLAGRMAVAYVLGVQSRKVGTSTKHFAVNNQEWERMTISAEIDERTLREIYLPAFKAAVQEGKTVTIMAAYNRVSGLYCCAQPRLLTDILKNEWGFKGLVVSDWGAVHGTVDSALAGLDLEMPGPGPFFGEPLLKAVQNGEVSEEILNDKVRRILRVIFSLGLFEKPDRQDEGRVDTPGHRALARESGAAGLVLLKNEKRVLPFDRQAVKSIAVIGPNAAILRTGGGGSSSVNPTYTVSPLDGLKNAAGKIAIRFSEGCILPGDLTPIPSEELCPPDGKEGEHGLRGEYFTNANLEGQPVLTRVDSQVNFDWGPGSPGPDIPPDYFSVRWTGRLTPAHSGSYTLGITSDDGCRLWLDGKLLFDYWVNQAGITRSAEVELEAGRAYEIRAEYFEQTGNAMVRLGWAYAGNRLIAEAAKLAAESDVAVVFAGISYQQEGEGFDRADLELPGEQNELIAAVARANPRTVVVLNNGTPLNMTAWIDQVPAVIEAFYPGQEGGNAIADVLFGDVNPSGKLPMTLPRRLEDTPAFAHYPGRDGKVHYREGLMVGYRYYDTREVAPLFPFGHGLSYTEFTYSNLQISADANEQNYRINVSVDVANTGRRAGAEVVQLYVRDVQSSLERPQKELKAFQKVALRPGEKKTVQLALDRSALEFYDPARNAWIAEPGEFEILVGRSSRDIRLKGKLDYEGK